MHEIAGDQKPLTQAMNRAMAIVSATLSMCKREATTVRTVPTISA